MLSMKKRSTRKALILGATFAIASTVLAGCATGAGDKAADKAPSRTADSTLAAMLPADIKEAGVLKVGTEAFYPPFEYLDEDNTTVVGLDMALFHAIGAELGLKVEVTNMAFDGLLPALDAKRIDVVVAAMTDTKARQAKYDFVDYFLTGQGIVVPAGNPKNVKGVEDMCGLKVAALEGSTQVSLLEKFNTEECAGDPITVTALATDADAMLQVHSGRADASFSQDAVARYNAAADGGKGKFEIGNDQPLLPVVMGPMFGKDDAELRDAVKAAVEKLIADGTYQSILDEHDLGSGAVTDVTVNGGTL